ncbi:low molecular weight protein-tyrosine-phosphatase [Roseibacillus persicicus]|uniref:Phosphotyrosine protein phosphatase n=1 Tax=Roseibacillus persicicus TaxID=454148 RepID=A0A918TE56_9BACT|nr:low molecular weight protein-tyrosine-phosphatase [Roseibacillus persicicus]MDQ8189203.1 low molecular weight phosphotyrosine protein phosphatase [Roseibacillus persicicus]GHC44039.1 phosphotyrosine protein phosphatase [Roseibacillus persicicus]
MARHTRILFVCLGNICRSPAAESTMRNLLQKHGVDSISLDSAGTAGYHIGKAPDPRMTTTLENRGVTVTGRARKFSAQDFGKFDLILAMDEENQDDMLMLAKTDEDRAKVRTFLSFSKKFEGPDVPDPYYGGPEGFELVADMMVDGCEGILRSLGKIQ